MGNLAYIESGQAQSQGFLAQAYTPERSAYEFWSKRWNDPELHEARQEFLSAPVEYGLGGAATLVAAVRYACACETRAVALAEAGEDEQADEIMLQCLVNIAGLVRRGASQIQDVQRSLESRFNPAMVAKVATHLAEAA